MARPENLALVRQALNGVADVIDINSAQLGDIKMAVTEACTNVILHAYKDLGPLEVDIDPNQERVDVTVRDSGTGFRPKADDTRPTRHLGMPLIGALADRVEITTGDSGRGTSVAMSFTLSKS